jgi:hypothetical protein
MKRTAGLLDTAREDMAEFLRNRRVIALSLIAALMTVGFMVGRQLATVLLTAIASRSLPSRQGVRSRLQSRRPCWSGHHADDRRASWCC